MMLEKQEIIGLIIILSWEKFGHMRKSTKSKLEFLLNKEIMSLASEDANGWFYD
ncbi:MAG: hypothetical protein ACW9XA_06795 [Candidatus Nitrosopumilus sp. bin_6a]